MSTDAVNPTEPDSTCADGGKARVGDIEDSSVLSLQPVSIPPMSAVSSCGAYEVSQRPSKTYSKPEGSQLLSSFPVAPATSLSQGCVLPAANNAVQGPKMIQNVPPPVAETTESVVSETPSAPSSALPNSDESASGSRDDSSELSPRVARMLAGRRRWLKAKREKKDLRKAHAQKMNEHRRKIHEKRKRAAEAAKSSATPLSDSEGSGEQPMLLEVAAIV